MADPSTTYVQMSLFDSDGATSLPGLADGIMPSDSPGGPKTGRCGRGVARANHSPLPGSDVDSMTSGTCGPNSSGSSASAALTQPLANKCRELLGSAGSMEYRQTWKQKATRSGRLYWAHTASVPRTSGNDCSGWPTPQTHDCRGGKTPEQVEAMREKTGAGVSNLNEVCYLAGWPTPAANEYEGGDPERVLERRAEQKAMHRNGNGFGLTLGMLATLSGWNTPRATDGSNGGPNQAGGALPADANLAGWASLGATDYKGSSAPGQLSEHAILGATSSSSPAGTENRGVLNPALALWLMGYPTSWLTAQAERVVCPAPNSSGDSATP